MSKTAAAAVVGAAALVGGGVVGLFLLGQPPPLAVPMSSVCLTDAGMQPCNRDGGQ